MSASEVETILLDTAHPSPDDEVRRYVNALGGVRAVFGNVPPNVTLRSPSPGDVPLNLPLRLSADVFDFEDAFPCCTASWTSDVEGLLGNSSDIDVAFTTPGPRSLTVTATDSQGGAGSASVTINTHLVSYKEGQGTTDRTHLGESRPSVSEGRRTEVSRKNPNGCLSLELESARLDATGEVPEGEEKWNCM